jgi:hypothetical protein
MLVLCGASNGTMCVQEADVVLSVLKVELDTGIASVTVEADSQFDALDKVPIIIEAVQVGFEATPYFGDAGGVSA